MRCGAARPAGTARPSAPLDLRALRAVGYRQAWEHLDGATSAAEFRDRGVYATGSWPSASSPGCAANWMRCGSTAAQRDGLETVRAAFLHAGSGSSRGESGARARRRVCATIGPSPPWGRAGDTVSAPCGCNTTITRTSWGTRMSKGQSLQDPFLNALATRTRAGFGLPGQRLSSCRARSSPSTSSWSFCAIP
jgi:hypothetical protein